MCEPEARTRAAATGDARTRQNITLNALPCTLLKRTTADKQTKEDNNKKTQPVGLAGQNDSNNGKHNEVRVLCVRVVEVRVYVYSMLNVVLCVSL